MNFVMHRILFAAPFLCACVASSATAAGQRPATPVIVTPKYGGYLLGFGVDPSGKEGLLSEYIALQNGKSFIATETFNQKTGKIVKVLAKKNNTENAYSTWGVFGQHAGIDEYYQTSGQTFPVAIPLSGNAFSGSWSFQAPQDSYLWSISGNLKNSDVAVTTFGFDTDLPTIVGSNVAANTFGTPVEITDQEFCDCLSPVVAFDDRTNQAVLASSYSTTPEIAIADLSNGNVTEFTGVGYGFVNGIAVDAKDGIAVTATEGGGFSEAGIQYYDLKKQTGIQILLPCSGNGSQDYAPLTVAFDSVNSLFLVEQYATSCSSGTAIDVYDAKGNLVEMLTQFATLPISPTPIALHPGDRTGFVYQDRTAETLQSFSY